MLKTLVLLLNYAPPSYEVPNCHALTDRRLLFYVIVADCNLEGHRTDKVISSAGEYEESLKQFREMTVTNLIKKPRTRLFHVSRNMNVEIEADICQLIDSRHNKMV